MVLTKRTNAAVSQQNRFSSKTSSQGLLQKQCHQERIQGCQVHNNNKQSSSLVRVGVVLLATANTNDNSSNGEDDDDVVLSTSIDIDEGPGPSPLIISPTLDVDGRLTSWQRLVNALPKIHKMGDDLDKTFMATFLPNMGNLAVVPLVNSVDTFWVGRMGVALALAGQAAANQAFFSLYFLVAFLPTITAPLVAKAIASGNTDQARDRVCEAIFLSTMFGLVGSVILVGMPRLGLRLVLPANAPAMEYAVPYVRLRAISMVPALVSATGFAAYRGLLNTVTPLKVSLATNLMNLVLDPLCIFGLPTGLMQRVGLGALGGRGFGAAGAALATALSETSGGIVYIKLLLRRKLVRWSKLLKPPSWTNMKPLVQGGSTMLIRQSILNVAFLSAARRAQVMDSSGVSAAAYGIVMQIYSIGIVIHLAVQSTAAALVPSARGLAGGPGEIGDAAAREVADRSFLWGTIIGIVLAVGQMALLPYLVPLFSTLPEVQQAVRTPALISALINLVNGPLFAGEGCLIGLERFKALATITGMGVLCMLACLMSPLGMTLNGVLLSIASFNACEAILLVYHHIRIGPLRRKRNRNRGTAIAN
jgi:putative MATE family efflux protein